MESQEYLLPTMGARDAIRAAAEKTLKVGGRMSFPGPFNTEYECMSGGANEIIKFRQDAFPEEMPLITVSEMNIKGRTDYVITVTAVDANEGLVRVTYDKDGLLETKDTTKYKKPQGDNHNMPSAYKLGDLPEAIKSNEVAGVMQKNLINGVFTTPVLVPNPTKKLAV